MYSSISKTDSAPKNPTERQVLTWLRKRIHPYCWGQSDRHKGDFEQTTKRQVLRSFRALYLDLPRSHLPKMKNPLMMAHFTGMLILYFQSDGRYDTPEVIACMGSIEE